MCFEPSQAVFWSLSCYKKLKLTIKPFTLHSLLIQIQKISLQSSGMRRKQNFGGKSFSESFRILGLDERKGTVLLKSKLTLEA